ncbi:hypothetical protein Clacol_008042 [Clathrus columnatus]|uniref:Uncharacterized protein n=1 Tax=Clathrus columnatus TaxID=1419009 RepID=A0AAV5AHF3_9AGAM|nr:hypothetical protein Clacol_008042 [Clathrus columnatus]
MMSAHPISSTTVSSTDNMTPHSVFSSTPTIPPSGVPTMTPPVSQINPTSLAHFPLPSASNNTPHGIGTPEGFLHKPKAMVGTFIAIGLVLVGGLILFLLLWRKRRRHKYPRKLLRGILDQDEGARLTGPASEAPRSQVSLVPTTSTHNYTSSQSYSLPEMEEMAEQPLLTIPSSPDHYPNILLTTVESAISSPATMQMALIDDESPVDPVDPFGPHRYSTRTIEIPSPNPFRTPRASIISGFVSNAQTMVERTTIPEGSVESDSLNISNATLSNLNEDVESDSLDASSRAPFQSGDVDSDSLDVSSTLTNRNEAIESDSLDTSSAILVGDEASVEPDIPGISLGAGAGSIESDSTEIFNAIPDNDISNPQRSGVVYAPTPVPAKKTTDASWLEFS